MIATTTPTITGAKAFHDIALVFIGFLLCASSLVLVSHCHACFISSGFQVPSITTPISIIAKTHHDLQYQILDTRNRKIRSPSARNNVETGF
jgi:hypothetical protein